MTQYLIRRVLFAIPTLLVISAVVYAILTEQIFRVNGLRELLVA